ncbi:PQQ-binding-like beta-propeller repeat protein [Streptomyces sp. NPDC059063]|uniref:outer membrane protein assembly factor BamB family protein n=1 Tax=unclassified Streptomyces TaxID=2593676 RepID=UPI00369EB3BD
MGADVVEDGRPRTGRAPILAGLAVAAAGAAIGLAAEFHYLGWTSIPGNSCGSRGPSCPDGTVPTILLAFLFSFAGVISAIAALSVFSRFRFGPAVPVSLLAAGVLIALWPGWEAYAWMRGPVLDSAWQGQRDRPSTVRGLGVWSVGEDSATVVRVRSDALVAYASQDGDRGWDLKAPARASVCGMSDAVVDGIGLVAFGRYHQRCDTVWGVDVRTGRKVWERRISGVPEFTAATDGLLTADAGVAVALADGAVRGYGLADGAPRWRTKLTGPRAAERGVRCQPKVASAAGGTTRVVVSCTEHGTFRSAELVTLDSATGKEESRRALPVESSVNTVLVVSADPFVLLVKEDDKRGVAAVLSYGRSGGEPVRIPLAADEEDLSVVPEGVGFAARPPLHAVVSGDALIVAATEPGADDPERVSAYSLRDGRHLWRTGLGTPVAALSPAGKGQVAVLGVNDRLWTLSDQGDRRGEDDGAMLRDVDRRIESGSYLLKSGDTWVVVNSNGDAYPPALALRP